MKHRDVHLGEWAADHFGIASRAELRAIGIGNDHIDHRVETGQLVTVHPGVYRLVGAPRSPLGELRAAVLAGGAHAFASHHGFAQLFGLRGGWDTRPEITVLGSAEPELEGVRVHRIDRLHEGDVTHRFGVPCLAPHLALLTLGARATERQVENAVHDAVFQRFTTPSDVARALADYGGRGRRGVAKLRKAARRLPVDGHTSQTGLELDLWRLLDAHGFPAARLQYPVRGADGRLRVLDIAYPEVKADIEAAGNRDHTSRLDQESDRDREAALNALGWEVLNILPHHLHVTPHIAVALCRSFLARRQHPFFVR